MNDNSSIHLSDDLIKRIIFTNIAKKGSIDSSDKKIKNYIKIQKPK